MRLDNPRMCTPTVSELPKPPLGKTGWPWTLEGRATEPRYSSGYECPQITLVTPSYNQAEFVETTIRSVLLQGYSNLEYFVMDGNSSDSSCDVIRKYEKWITAWVSESDRGQSHAINKGLAKATGRVFGWLNSCALGFSWTLDCERVLAGGVSRWGNQIKNRRRRRKPEGRPETPPGAAVGDGCQPGASARRCCVCCAERISSPCRGGDVPCAVEIQRRLGSRLRDHR